MRTLFEAPSCGLLVWSAFLATLMCCSAGSLKQSPLYRSHAQTQIDDFTDVNPAPLRAAVKDSDAITQIRISSVSGGVVPGHAGVALDCASHDRQGTSTKPPASTGGSYPELRPGGPGVTPPSVQSSAVASRQDEIITTVYAVLFGVAFSILLTGVSLAGFLTISHHLHMMEHGDIKYMSGKENSEKLFSVPLVGTVYGLAIVFSFLRALTLFTDPQAVFMNVNHVGEGDAVPDIRLPLVAGAIARYAVTTYSHLNRVIHWTSLSYSNVCYLTSHYRCVVVVFSPAEVLIWHIAGTLFTSLLACIACPILANALSGFRCKLYLGLECGKLVCYQPTYVHVLIDCWVSIFSADLDASGPAADGVHLGQRERHERVHARDSHHPGVLSRVGLSLCSAVRGLLLRIPSHGPC